MGKVSTLVMRSWLASARGRFVAAVLCVTFLTYLLLSQDPWWLFRAFPKEATRTLKHGIIDKVYHFVAYFGTTCVLMWYAASGTRRSFYSIAVAVTIHAVATEFLQQFVPRRTTDIDDLVANLVGVSAGVITSMLIRRSLLRTAADASFKMDEVASPLVPGTLQNQPSRAEATPEAALQRVGGSPIHREMQLSGESPLALSSSSARFERLSLSSEQIAEVQPRQINYRLLGILGGVVALTLASTYAVHGWQVRRMSGVLLQTARKARVAGDMGEALTCFEQYCYASPDDVNALAEFAILSDDLRERPDGGKGVFMLFERVLRKDPTRDDVRRRLIDVAIELARYPDALSHLKVLQQTFPKEGWLDYQAGLCHERSNDYPAAATAFLAAIDDTPELIEPWERLAWLQHFRLGQPSAADQLMQKLVQVNSQDVDALIARAKFRLKTQQFDLAGDDIASALKLAPNEFRVLDALGEVGTARAMYAQAEGKVSQAERIAIETGSLLAREDQSPSNQRRLDLRRIVLEAEFGSLNRALVLGNKLLSDVDSQDLRVVCELMAEIAIDHGRTEQAIESLDQLPRSEITDGQRLRVSARVAMSESRWEDAVGLLQKAREMLAESPTHLLKTDMQLAECFTELQQTERLLVTYRRVLKYSPQSIAARMGLASTLATAGRYPEALAEYRQLAHVSQVRLELAEHLIDYNIQLPEVARDWQEVLILLDAAGDDEESSLRWTVAKARVLIEKKEFDEARLLVRLARRDQPENNQLLAMQIRIAETSGDVAEISRLKGKTFAQAGQLEEAERQLKSALSESPSTGDAALSLVQFYLRHGRKGQAVETFREHASDMTASELSRMYEIFGDLRNAHVVLQQELHKQPENKAVLREFSEFLIRNQRSDLAEPLLEQLLSLPSDILDADVRAARRSLALLLAQKQNYRDFLKASALMDQNAAEVSPIATSDLRTMATLLQYSPLSSDDVLAIGLLEKVDDRRQMTPEDRWQLAMLYLKAGLPKQATPQFERAAQAGFAAPQFLTDFTLHLIRSGDLAQIKEKIEGLPATFPQSDRVQLKARYHVALGEVAMAVAALDAFIESKSLNSTHAERLVLAAETCRDLLRTPASAHDAGLVQATDRYFQMAVEEAPGHVDHLITWLIERDRDVEAFELLGNLWQHLSPELAASLSLDMLRAASNRHRRDRVEQYLITHIQRQPDSLELKLHLAELRSLSEEYSEAERLYRDILREDSRHVAALNGLAWQLAMQGRLLDEAMTFVERAISEAGPISQLLDTRGCVKLAQSRLRAAIVDFQAAVESSESPATLLHLAFAKAESGDSKQAEKAFTRAIDSGLQVERLHPLDRSIMRQIRQQVHHDQVESGRMEVEL